MNRRAARAPAGLALATLGLLVSMAAVADADVYESADELVIGRVFLTPAERASLDQRRRLPRPALGDASPSGAAARKPAAGRTRQPAGYIISSNGERRDWTGGDFVASDTDAAANQSFPGDVRITRHSSRQVAARQPAAEDPRSAQSDDDVPAGGEPPPDEAGSGNE